NSPVLPRFLTTLAEQKQQHQTTRQNVQFAANHVGSGGLHDGNRDLTNMSSQVARPAKYGSVATVMFVAGVSEQNENPGDISLAGRPRSTSCRQTASSALPLQPASKARQNRQGQGAGRVWLKQLSLR